jgi:PAS domain S-box-containing protein
VRTRTGKILENLEDAVVAVGPDGRITVFNRAAEILFDTAKPDRIGIRLESSAFPCAAALLDSIQRNTASSVPRFECEVRGEKRILSVHTSLVHNAAGAIETAILVATDITARDQLETRMRREEKSKAMGDMAAAVAHEIRNPINAIGMIAQRFRKEFRPAQDEPEYLTLADSVVREVRRVDGIVRRFLAFARFAPVRPVPIDLGGFVEELAVFFKSSAMAKGVTFLCSRADAAVANADPDLLRQAVLNLLANALDAAPAGGNVTLAGKFAPGTYTIEVEDTGAGLPDAVRQRLFEPGFTTKPGGTGTGLAVASQVVHAHGGTLEADNRAEGGAVFRIRLSLEEST